MENILITGSRGFVGTAIRKKMKYPYSEVDLKIGSDHRNIKGRTGVLIFLSSWVQPKESARYPVKYIENNLTDLSSILTNNNFSKVIFPSSHTVYDRDGNLEPVSVYGITKLAGEKLIKICCKDYWILRLGNPYGENDERSMFSQLAHCKKVKGRFEIYEMDGLVRDYFPVSHIASIVNEILDGKIKPGIYNVGTGKGTNVFEFMKRICRRYDIDSEVVSSPDWVADSYIPTVDLLKAEELDLEEEWKKYLL